jgi:hypothetical protein
MNLLEQMAAQAKVTGDIGERLDQELEETRAQILKYEGGVFWLKDSTKGVGGLAEHVRKDFEEGKLENLDGKAVHDLLLAYNQRAIECMLSLAEKLKADGLVANGKLVGIRGALELTQRHHTAATARAAQITAAIENEIPAANEDEARAARRERLPGEHPGPSPLEARRQEALQQSFKKRTSKLKVAKK